MTLKVAPLKRLHRSCIEQVAAACSSVEAAFGQEWDPGSMQHVFVVRTGMATLESVDRKQQP